MSGTAPSTPGQWLQQLVRRLAGSLVLYMWAGIVEHGCTHVCGEVWLGTVGIWLSPLVYGGSVVCDFPGAA